MRGIEIFETDPERIGKMCDEHEKENFKFRNHIKSDDFDQARFNRIVDEVEKRIDCKECGNCCKALFPVVTKEDTRRIAGHLNISDSFMGRYTTENAEGKTMLKDKPCIFLADCKCRIYDIRPRVCRYFPDVRRDLTDRTFQLMYTARICPIVFNALENAKKMMLR